MKLLTRVKLVQFFLYEQEDIRISTISGIFGPNGSGKSSLLDAVQISMFGANGNLVALNAQADDDRSRAGARSIRQYCLGVTGSGEESRARDRALSYITLVWEDTVTREPLSMGVCISAAIDREAHDVLGRYVVPGLDLAMDDHLEAMEGGGAKPLDWLTFRNRLQERARRMNVEEPFFNDSERYISAMLLALRGSGAKPNPDAFKRAFRFALKMRFDNKSVDEIVRYQILEPRPTDIRRFREITETFRRLSELVNLVERKLKDGALVEHDFAQAHDEARNVAAYDALASVVQADRQGAALDEAKNAAEYAKEALDKAQTSASAAQRRLDATRRDLVDTRTLRDGHRAHAEQGSLPSRIEGLEERVRQKFQEIRRNVGFLRSLAKDASECAHLAQGDRETLANTAEQLRAIEIADDAIDTNAIAAALSPYLHILNRAANGLLTVKQGADTDVERARKDLEALKRNVERVRKGLVALDPSAQRLMMELNDRGIEARPVCDLVRITDAQWQPVIESYLASNLQALLVDEADERRAFELYRSLKGPRAVYGAKVVLPGHQDAGKRATQGSVAELIEGDDPIAVAFLRSQFGDTRRAHDADDARGSRRTLTVDGMLVRGGAMDRLQPRRPEDFRVGVRDSQALQETLEKQIAIQTKALEPLERAKREIDALWNRFLPVADANVVARNFESLARDLAALAKELDSLRTVLTEQADEEYVRLCEEVKRLDELAQSTESEKAQFVKDEATFATKLNQAQAEVQKAEGDFEAARKRVEIAESHEDFDKALASRLWDQMTRREDTSSEALEANCTAEREKARARLNRHSHAGSEKLGQFLSSYNERAPQSVREQWKEALTWIRQYLATLRNTELVNHKSKMEEALQTSRETFRNDVAVRLYENLERLDETMEALNEVLRNCPAFSNGERYRFRRTARPQFESLLRFIRDVGTHGPTEDLLGGAGQVPEIFKELLEDRIAPGNASTKSPLDDYREFYEFDIELLHQDPASGAWKAFERLSKRLGPGSGGEHRAPLYVIAGAALASAYRLGRNNADGLRLMLLDEAFHRMDANNIVATMRYLEDLGLQVFMASPGEYLGTLTAFLHRYYDILKDPVQNQILLSGHDVSAQTREMFRADMTEFHPELIEAEVNQLGAELLSDQAARRKVQVALPQA